jgi:branched-chain amino acid transport system permease protein
VIVLSFAVVVIGGLGSLPGAAVGAVMVGLVRSLSVITCRRSSSSSSTSSWPRCLRCGPRGLFSLAEPRRI